MAIATPEQPKPALTSKAGARQEFDPDSYRMTLGEHLEELRTRMVLSLAGFGLALIICFIFGEKVVWAFCLPLMKALYANHQNPQIYMSEASESFMVYIKISMICAAAIASPWMLYQFWLFVAAGLYPKERQYITKYLPLSIALLISGMVFLYYIVLPLMLRFFLGFNIGLPLTFPPTPIDTTSTQINQLTIPLLHGDPSHPKPGMLFFDADESRLKIVIGTAANPDIRVIPFGSSQLVSPMITLSAYIDMVIGMLLSFGLAFQMPLVVLGLVRMEIVDVPTLKKARKYVWFIIAIVAGVIVPDVVGGMIALMIPLMLLFEMGMWMARDRNAPRKPGNGQWKRTFADWWKRANAGGMSQKFITYIAVLLLVALLVHALLRLRGGTPAPKIAPATAPAFTTQPTTAPTTNPG